MLDTQWDSFLVETLVRHRPPMLLVDRLVDKDDNGCRCEVDISESSLFWEDGGVPAYAGIEYMAQTIGVFDGVLNREIGNGPRLGFLLGGPQVRFYRSHYESGCTLLVEARKTWDGGRMVQFSCSIRDQRTGELLAEGDFNVYAPEDDPIRSGQEE